MMHGQKNIKLYGG